MFYATCRACCADLSYGDADVVMIGWFRNER